MLAGNRGIVLTLACGLGSRALPLWEIEPSHRWGREHARRGCPLSTRASNLHFALARLQRPRPRFGPQRPGCSEQRSCHSDRKSNAWGRNRSPRAAAAPRRKHGGHAHAPRATASLRDAAALPATTNDTNEAQRALPPNQNHLAAALARHPSKKKGPAHVPDPRDRFRTSRAVEDA